MRTGDALSTLNSNFKARIVAKTSWGKNELLDVWTEELLKVMHEAANDGTDQ